MIKVIGDPLYSHHVGSQHVFQAYDYHKHSTCGVLFTIPGHLRAYTYIM